MERSVNLASFASAFAGVTAEQSSLGEDYIFSRFTSAERLKLADSGPVRVSGMSWILCIEGSLEIELNLRRTRLTSNSLLVVFPDSIVEVKDVDTKMECYVLMVSPDFMRTTNIDLNVMGSLPMIYHHNIVPQMKMSHDEMALLQRYFDLIHLNTMSNPDGLYVRSITRTLISAMLYQTIQFAAKQIKAHDAEADSQRPRTRRMSYVSQFMQLVRTFHRRERSVSFYSAKLFITTKYLSMIVKETTGRSAAEWIDEYVILEAKNLLRFSDMTIKQVSNEFNFPNQSAFGKYFKHLTGMSPTEYQRS